MPLFINMKNKVFLFIILSIVCISCHKSSSCNYSETNPYALSENLRKSFIDEKNKRIFPSYYGGSFIEDSSLVVIVISDTIHCKKDLIKRCNGANFTLFYCRKRQDAIRKILHHLYTFRTEEKNKEIVEELQFRNSFMNAAKRVSIELLTFQEDSFRQYVLDSPFLDFEKSILLFE